MNKEQNEPHEQGNGFSIHSLQFSALLTVIGVIVLFSTAVITILIAPSYIDSSWTSHSSPYQAQMYEIEDPNIYISSASSHGLDLQYVRHLKQDFTLLAFKESEEMRLLAPPELEKYITKLDGKTLKLTSRLLLIREPQDHFKEIANQRRAELQKQNTALIKAEPGKVVEKINYQFMELYDPKKNELFALDPLGAIIQNWVDENYLILDDSVKQKYHSDKGVIYAINPREYRVKQVRFGDIVRWRYDPEGMPVKSLEDLQGPGLDFHSRKELIYYGEHIYAIEGCWYCHTDQTRTLIQDVVLNGSDSFPAPPSSPNEYIYQKITFPGTRRIGPDLSRVAVKRPSRDWHKSHFWSPKTASAGSIMPSFRHFFDNDPRGTGKSAMGIPNHEFEAIFQYMMTKGTRITPPTQAWWLGNDPVQTKEIIEGKVKIR